MGTRASLASRQVGEVSGSDAGVGAEKIRRDEGERFGPTLAAEHLAEEDGLVIDHETLRRWLLEEGLWSCQRERKAHRTRREAKADFGELVQMDGSFHAWLEERGEGGCMMNLVDDATTETLLRGGSRRRSGRPAQCYANGSRNMACRARCIRTGKMCTYGEPHASERGCGEQPFTQFGRMCAKLGIRIIAANSPQAKGRVERNHGTHQDRLVKKMRRKHIGTHAAANTYLEQEYLPEHNRRYRRKPASEADFHRRSPGARELDKISRLETERVISNDWVVQYDHRWLQLQKQSRSYAPVKARVTVCEWEDGRLEIEYRGQKLPWKEIGSRPIPASSAARPASRSKNKPWIPARNHPWRNYPPTADGAAVLVGGTGATP